MQGHVLLSSGSFFNLMDLDSPNNPKIQEADILIPLRSRFRWGCAHPIDTFPRRINVVEHSIAVACLVFRECHSAGITDAAHEIILAALLHDVHEALLSDIPSTIMSFVKIEYSGHLVPWSVFEPIVRNRIVRDVWGVENLPFNHPFIQRADQDVRFHEIKWLCNGTCEENSEWFSVAPAAPACSEGVDLTNIWMVANSVALFKRLVRVLQNAEINHVYEFFKFIPAGKFK